MRWVSTGVLGLMFAVCADAQVVVRGGYRGYGWGYRYPWGAGGVTSTESRARGYAQAIRAEADAAKTAAETEKIRQETKWQSTQIFLEKRRLYKERQQEELERVRARNQARHQRSMARMEQPKPTLSPDELDPLTGELHWPAVLATDDFAEYRQDLDKFFKTRADQGGYLKADQYFGVQGVISDMTDLLKSKITTLDTRDYLLAYNFLKKMSEMVRSG